MPKVDLPSDLAPQPSVRNTLFAFACAAVYGVFALPGFVAGRELLQILIQRATAPLIVNAANAGGYTNLAAISSVGIMALAWLVTVMIVWHRAEHAKNTFSRLRIAGSWTLCALVFFACACGLIWLLTGHAPRLTAG